MTNDGVMLKTVNDFVRRRSDRSHTQRFSLSLSLPLSQVWVYKYNDNDCLRTHMCAQYDKADSAEGNTTLYLRYKYQTRNLWTHTHTTPYSEIILLGVYYNHTHRMYAIMPRAQLECVIMRLVFIKNTPLNQLDYNLAVLLLCTLEIDLSPPLITN